jgi:hypothetical protein
MALAVYICTGTLRNVVQCSPLRSTNVRYSCQAPLQRSHVRHLLVRFCTIWWEVWHGLRLTVVARPPAHNGVDLPMQGVDC